MVKVLDGQYQIKLGSERGPRFAEIISLDSALV